jgi:hypothetical protein
VFGGIFVSGCKCHKKSHANVASSLLAQRASSPVAASAAGECNQAVALVPSPLCRVFEVLTCLAAGAGAGAAAAALAIASAKPFDFGLLVLDCCCACRSAALLDETVLIAMVVTLS